MQMYVAGHPVPLDDLCTLPAVFIPTVFTNRPLSGGSKDGEITHDDYRHMSDDYKQQAESIYTVLCTLPCVKNGASLKMEWMRKARFLRCFLNIRTSTS